MSTKGDDDVVWANPNGTGMELEPYNESGMELEPCSMEEEKGGDVNVSPLQLTYGDDDFQDDVELVEEDSSSGDEATRDLSGTQNSMEIPLSQMLQLTQEQRLLLLEQSSDEESESGNETESENDDTDCSWNPSEEELSDMEHEDDVEFGNAHPHDCGCTKCALMQHQCAECEGFFEIEKVRAWEHLDGGGSQWLCEKCWESVQPSMGLMVCLRTDDNTTCNAIAGPLIGDQEGDSDASDLICDTDICIYCEDRPTRSDLGEFCSRKCMRKHEGDHKKDHKKHEGDHKKDHKKHEGDHKKHEGDHKKHEGDHKKHEGDHKKRKHLHSMVRALGTSMIFPSQVQEKRREEGRDDMIIDELDHQRM